MTANIATAITRSTSSTLCRNFLKSRQEPSTHLNQRGMLLTCYTTPQRISASSKPWHESLEPLQKSFAVQSPLCFRCSLFISVYSCDCRISSNFLLWLMLCNYCHITLTFVAAYQQWQCVLFTVYAAFADCSLEFDQML